MNSATLITKFLIIAIATLCAAEPALAGDLEEQVQQLSSMLERRPVMRLNADKFRRYIGSQSVPRNYSFIVMMTALSPQRVCHVCRHAYEEFVVVANSYRSSQHSDSKRLFFGFVDYDEGSEIFNSLKIDSAPCFLYFDEKGQFRKPDELNIHKMGFSADVISRWIAEKTGMTFKIIRPPSFFLPVVLIVMGLVGAGILYISKDSLSMIFNRNLWAFSAVAIVLLMTSGQMWNHIRGAALMQRGRNHDSYIHSSSNTQYIVETYLVMFINAGLGIGLVLMTDNLRVDEKSDLKRKKFLARVGFFMVIVFFSLLLSVFRQKSYGYPYRLLF